MISVDTSIAVAAALPWHEAYADARSALPRRPTPLLAHVGIETYSVLTRLPAPQRIPPSLARTYLEETFLLPPLVLPAEGHVRLLELVATAGIAGGAVYDALVGATAREAGATLITLDHRAIATYRLLDVDYRLVG